MRAPGAKRRLYGISLFDIALCVYALNIVATLLFKLEHNSA